MSRLTIDAVEMRTFGDLRGSRRPAARDLRSCSRGYGWLEVPGLRLSASGSIGYVFELGDRCCFFPAVCGAGAVLGPPSTALW